MDDKLKKKITGLIDSIYFLYFTTGVIYCGQLFNSIPPPKGFSESIGMFMLIIIHVIFWLPVKIVELF